MNFIAALIRTIIGAAFGLLSAIALIPALAAMTPADGGGPAPIVTLVIVLIGAALGLFATSIRRAFGRGFLVSGISLLALPLSTALLSGQAVSEVVQTSVGDDQAFAAVGAGMGAVAMTGAAAFIGLILGGIFVVIGLVLVLGGRREVVVIERSAR